MDLSTKYLGLDLKNPIIVGSSGLTDSVDKIKELEDNNAAAVVLKSLFEEQIIADTKNTINQSDTKYTEAFDLVSRYTRDHSINEYITLIQDAKAAVDIPVIASINCTSGDEWISFAKTIQEAGADALELNISLLPSDETRTSGENESMYFEIVKAVKDYTSMPLSLKLSQYSSGLAKLITELSWTKMVDGFVLFNRYYSPDIDIDNYNIISSNIYSTPAEISTSLRWIAILSHKLENSLAASTGVHDGAGVVKQILAGADAVQIVSAIYKNNPGHIVTVLKELEEWMERNTFDSLDQFRGKTNYKHVKNPAAFERVQFMKYYSKIQ
jgi:dihydroorotate dehydrogenase (fumarate)